MNRSEAKSLGLKRYTSGKDCPKGHSSGRYTSSGSCIDCCTPSFTKVVCLHCGIEFKTRVREKSREIKYCSKKCYGLSIAIIKKCETCGKDYYNYQNERFCSMKCSGISRAGVPLSGPHREALKGQRLHTRGENSHRWKGGCKSRQRSRHEYVEWRTAVYKRDGYSCVDCGKKSSKGLAIYLEAHHIKHWAKHIGLRFEVENGVTLCKQCHIDRHKQERIK